MRVRRISGSMALLVLLATLVAATPPAAAWCSGDECHPQCWDEVPPRLNCASPCLVNVRGVCVEDGPVYETVRGVLDELPPAPDCTDVLASWICFEVEAKKQAVESVAENVAPEAKRQANAAVATAKATAYPPVYALEGYGDARIDEARPWCQLVLSSGSCERILPHVGGTLDFGRGVANTALDMVEGIGVIVLLYLYLYCSWNTGGWDGCYTLFPYWEGNPLRELPRL